MLTEQFYASLPTLHLAQELLGCELVHKVNNQITSGIIVETEAYLKDDPGCHAFNKKTNRNAPMFESPGHAYVYLIYGMYHCFNVVSGPKGTGEAVLIRALEPTSGLNEMSSRRKTRNKMKLCSGPGKLCIALGINKDQNLLSLTGPSLFINHIPDRNFELVQTTRIGLSKGTELPYRFYIKNNPYISKT